MSRNEHFEVGYLGIRNYREREEARAEIEAAEVERRISEVEPVEDSGYPGIRNYRDRERVRGDRD